MATINTYFDIEGLMIDRGTTGETIVRKIMSNLDLKSLRVSQRISKTFYRFLDKEKSLWMRHLKGAIKDVQKMRKFLSNEIFEQWLKLAELIESNGNAADVISFIPRFYDSYKHRQDGISFKQVSYTYLPTSVTGGSLFIFAFLIRIRLLQSLSNLK